MSHSFVVVILPEGISDVREGVEKLLAPFDENIPVPEYERDCWCVGSKAAGAGREAADTQVGPIDPLRDSYWAMPEDERPEWRDHIADWESKWDPVAKATAEAHPLYQKPDPDCCKGTEGGCGGTGKYLFTYNPKSRWDWWRVGGRWDGLMTNQDADSADGGFNFDDRHETSEKNSCQVKSLPEDFSCFAILTPDGEWHEKGRMGWFGAVRGEKDTWLEEMQAIFARHPDHLAVGCDLHI